ncbi:hypothetical protein [Bradyrhizobium uaiense]|uniref:PepSY domain-containing protein n=1 Tax=Bradyrhizobium uaiense TaxID=2594946 RepID=A0A6P1BAI6_9BRAD|nr:hypothetical protein [Bradyrhizobium uaiense]NEU95293.1 hypothetical protein [Bradyrhizobium uaiense]
MNPQKLCLALCLLAPLGALQTASALTLEEIKAKLEAAGFSQVREVPSGKIKAFKATKDGKVRSILVDSTGYFQELQ